MMPITCSSVVTCPEHPAHGHRCQGPILLPGRDLRLTSAPDRAGRGWRCPGRAASRSGAVTMWPAATGTRPGRWSRFAGTSRRPAPSPAGPAPAHVRAAVRGGRRPGLPEGHLRRRQVKDAPSTGTGGELPASDEEAIFWHYNLAGAANKAAAIGRQSWPPAAARPARRACDPARGPTTASGQSACCLACHRPARHIRAATEQLDTEDAAPGR